MPANLTYPGLYIEEIPSGVRPITNASTADTAFCDFFARGPVDKAVRITSWSDFERQFGGLHRESEASYAIQQYYLNGGQIAWVVRVVDPEAQTASATLSSVSYLGSGASGASGANGGTGADVLKIEAASPGKWGNKIQVGIDYNTRNPNTEFNLVVREIEEDATGRRQVRGSEIYRNLSMDTTSSRFVDTVVNVASTLVKVTAQSMGERPGATHADAVAAVRLIEDTQFQPLGQAMHTTGTDGVLPSSTDWKNNVGSKALLGEGIVAGGIYALTKIAPFNFNILCLPAVANLSPDSRKSVNSKALTFCGDNRAFYIVDLPAAIDEAADDKAKMALATAFKDELDISRNGAVYFPRVQMPDSLRENRPRLVGSSGTLAGVYARTDATRGVWKAPAGVEAGLRGLSLDVKLTDDDNGGLNPLGVNALRSFPVFNNVSWGARTLEGADVQASEYKYIPVRRTALFIEQSLLNGLKWVVFEPNAEPLWAQIRLNVGAFMHNLFRQGAFQGTTPREAYLVKCDKETTTQTDINLGIVNILVGFAPLKPAEFVVIKIQQLAGQIET